MPHDRSAIPAGRFILTSIMISLSITHSASAQQKCTQTDPDFLLSKEIDKYDVFYKNSQVYRVDKEELDGLFGGKPPTVSCEKDVGSKNIIGVVVGWKFDLLIAFGILRDINGRAVRLNKLSWVPHSGAFDPIKVEGDDILAFYGNSWTRICWNLNGSQTWSFITDAVKPPMPGSCLASMGPKGSSQYLISVPN